MRACVRACVRARARAIVFVCVRASFRVRVRDRLENNELFAARARLYGVQVRRAPLAVGPRRAVPGASRVDPRKHRNGSVRSPT